MAPCYVGRGVQTCRLLETSSGCYFNFYEFCQAKLSWLPYVVATTVQLENKLRMAMLGATAGLKCSIHKYICVVDDDKYSIAINVFTTVFICRINIGSIFIGSVSIGSA